MDLKTWLGLFERGFAVAGFTLFSTALTSGLCRENLLSGVIAGGLYLFVEALRMLKIDPTTIKNKKAYGFIIF